MIVYAWRCSVCHVAFIMSEAEHKAAAAFVEPYEEAIFVHERWCSRATGQAARVRPFAQWAAEAIT